MHYEPATLLPCQVTLHATSARPLLSIDVGGSGYEASSVPEGDVGGGEYLPLQIFEVAKIASFITEWLDCSWNVTGSHIHMHVTNSYNASLGLRGTMTWIECLYLGGWLGGGGGRADPAHTIKYERGWLRYLLFPGMSGV